MGGSGVFKHRTAGEWIAANWRVRSVDWAVALLPAFLASRWVHRVTDWVEVHWARMRPPARPGQQPGDLRAAQPWIGNDTPPVDRLRPGQVWYRAPGGGWKIEEEQPTVERVLVSEDENSRTYEQRRLRPPIHGADVISPTLLQYGVIVRDERWLARLETASRKA